MCVNWTGTISGSLLKGFFKNKPCDVNGVHVILRAHEYWAQSIFCRWYSHTGRTGLSGHLWRSVCHLDSRPHWSSYPHETDSSLFVTPPSTQQCGVERIMTEDRPTHILSFWSCDPVMTWKQTCFWIILLSLQGWMGFARVNRVRIECVWIHRSAGEWLDQQLRHWDGLVHSYSSLIFIDEWSFPQLYRAFQLLLAHHFPVHIHSNFSYAASCI